MCMYMCIYIKGKKENHPESELVNFKALLNRRVVNRDVFARRKIEQ